MRLWSHLAQIGTSVHWAVVTDADLMYFCRFHFKLVAVTDKLYATSGQDKLSVACYSPKQNSWNFMLPLLTPLVEFFAFMSGKDLCGRWLHQEAG